MRARTVRKWYKVEHGIAIESYYARGGRARFIELHRGNNTIRLNRKALEAINEIAKQDLQIGGKK
jgi:hypothetical protein